MPINILKIIQNNNADCNKEEFKIGQIDVKALFTICHTSASVSFYLQDENEKAVFTGKVFQSLFFFILFS